MENLFEKVPQALHKAFYFFWNLFFYMVGKRVIIIIIGSLKKMPFRI